MVISARVIRRLVYFSNLPRRDLSAIKVLTKWSTVDYHLEYWKIRLFFINLMK